MRRAFVRIGTSLLNVGLVAAVAVAPALAQDTGKAPPPAAATSASAEVKAGTGVENRELVGEGTSFAAGTKVWIWSRVTGASGSTVKHVWKKDGKPVWTATLKVGSNRWTTYSRRLLSKAGDYAVDVVGADDQVLGTVSFTVQ